MVIAATVAVLALLVLGLWAVTRPEPPTAAPTPESRREAARQEALEQVVAADQEFRRQLALHQQSARRKVAAIEAARREQELETRHQRRRRMRRALRPTRRLS